MIPFDQHNSSHRFAAKSRLGGKCNSAFLIVVKEALQHNFNSTVCCIFLFRGGLSVISLWSRQVVS